MEWLSDVIRWMNVDRGDLMVASFMFVVAVAVAAMTWRYMRATEKQAEAASVSAAAAEESVNVAKGAAEAVQASAAAAQDQASAAWESAQHAREGADAARMQLEQDLRLFQEQKRPYVYADIRGDDQQPVLLVVVIENVGPTVATDVVVTFDPPLQSSQIKQLSNMPTLRVGALPPGRRIKYNFDTGFAYFAAGRPLVYNVRVTAKSHHGPTELAYPISLEDLKGTSAAVDSGSLKDVVEAIRRLESPLSNLPTAIRMAGRLGEGSHHNDESIPPVTE